MIVFFADKADSYVFAALCIKSHFYKNPYVQPDNRDWEAIIVDGPRDGGVDILMSDPSSETSDLIIGQSKFCHDITREEVENACIKMAAFYKDMLSANYEDISQRVQSRFLTLNAEVGEESKIVFILFTSAERRRINIGTVERKFYEQFSDTSNIELAIFFASDVTEEIKETASRLPTVANGSINIDKANNFLAYDEDAMIVNVSALSLKRLYAQHGTNLLASNLRYHIRSGRDIDKAIDETINAAPDLFWLKNNGITIICDSFDFDGPEVKLTNFSVINGGQTVYVLHKSRNIVQNKDFYLPCKIIRSRGNNNDEKSLFSLEIAKAANAQKPIRDIDLKANSPEQVHFAQAMRTIGVFYQTKRGEAIPRDFQAGYMNLDLADVGKLCLCAIFQIPCSSRSKPSLLYRPQYYDVIFNRDQHQIARICRDILYVDYFFRDIFIDEYCNQHQGPGQIFADDMTFAKNARTICIAFVAFASRYVQGNISEAQIAIMASASSAADTYDAFKAIQGVKYILPDKLFDDKDRCDGVLRKLFRVMISSGRTVYSIAKGYAPAVTATNFLKNDTNYYKILSSQWDTIRVSIEQIFTDIDMR